jgi:hypothetical protein
MSLPKPQPRNPWRSRAQLHTTTGELQHGVSSISEARRMLPNCPLRDQGRLRRRESVTEWFARWLPRRPTPLAARGLPAVLARTGRRGLA